MTFSLFYLIFKWYIYKNVSSIFYRVILIIVLKGKSHSDNKTAVSADISDFHFGYFCMGCLSN